MSCWSGRPRGTRNNDGTGRDELGNTNNGINSDHSTPDKRNSLGFIIQLQTE
jgi:hypothetical protein